MFYTCNNCSGEAVHTSLKSRCWQILDNFVLVNKR